MYGHKLSNLGAMALVILASCVFSQDADDWRFQDPIQRLRQTAAAVNKGPREESSIGVRIGKTATMILIEEMTEAEAKEADSAKQFEKVTEATIHRQAAWAVLNSLATMPNLEELEFCECNFDHQASFLSDIAKRCPKLKILRFQQCRVSRYVFRFMPTFESVEEFELDETYVGDGIIPYATCFPKLETAELICSGAGNRDAADLAKLKHLRSVGFHECALSAKGLRKLAASKSIESILSEFVEVTHEESIAIEKEFPKVKIETMLEPALE